MVFNSQANKSETSRSVCLLLLKKKLFSVCIERKNAASYFLTGLLIFRLRVDFKTD